MAGSTLIPRIGPAPLLQLFAEPTVNDTVPGHYDADQEVWVVEEGERTVPLAVMPTTLSQTRTATKMKPETADQDFA